MLWISFRMFAKRFILLSINQCDSVPLPLQPQRGEMFIETPYPPPNKPQRGDRCITKAKNLMENVTVNCLNRGLTRITRINAERTKLTRFALSFAKKEGFDLFSDRNPRNETRGTVCIWFVVVRFIARFAKFHKKRFTCLESFYKSHTSSSSAKSYFPKRSRANIIRFI